MIYYQSSSVFGFVEQVVPLVHIFPILVLIHAHLHLVASPSDPKVILLRLLFNVYVNPGFVEIVGAIAAFLFSGPVAPLSSNHYAAFFVDV